MDKGSYKSLTTQDGTAFSEPGPSSQDCTIPNSSTSRSTSGRLCEAIMLSDENEVQRLLAKLKSGEVNMNMEDCYTEGILPRPMTIIHIAAKKQDQKYLELLLQSEVFKDVNTKDGLGYTPLMHAADAGRIENVRLLIQENADISAESKSRSEGADVRLLVQSEASKSADRKPDRSLQKCLKRTVFHIAAGRGHKDIIKELFKNRNREDIDCIVNREDDNGWTPLFWAAQSRNLECFKLLLGTELREKTDKLKRNIFHIIAENDCHEMLQYILTTYELSEELTQTDTNERTPFMTSVYKGNVKTAKLLIEHEKKLYKNGNGNTVFYQDVNGNTVFHLAAERGGYDTLQFLLSPHIEKLKFLLNNDKVFLANATQTGKSSVDKTLLQQVVKHAQLSESLEHHFNNIWYPDELVRINKDGNNCFHLAAGRGDIRSLHILYACCITMQQGFVSFPLKYLDMKNKSQVTPLHYAIGSRSPDVIKFLVTHGADLMSRTKLLPILPNISDEVDKENDSDEVDGSSDATRCASFKKLTKTCMQREVPNCMQREMPTSLHYILKMPNGTNIIKELFNESVSYRSNGDDRDELVVDFQLLISNSGLRMEITHEIFRQRNTGVLDVLLHPLLKSFIKTEWLKRKYFPWFRFTTYILYLLSLTLYAWLPPDENFSSKVIEPLASWLVGILSVMIIVFCVPYILPGKTVWERLEGIIQKLPPPVFALIAIIVRIFGVNPLPYRSLAVILSWLSLIFYSSTLTSFNQQAAQFQTVLFTMLSNVPVFFIVVFGFAFSFYVLYFKEDNFDNIWSAFLYTSVVLLHGGMDDSPYFSRNTTEVAQEMFMLFAEGFISFLFAIVVTLALLNMLVGLAISSAEELRKEGRLVFMRHQVTLLFELDQILEKLKHVRESTLWKRIRGVKSYSVTHPDTIPKDHRMVVNNDNTSLEDQIQLHDIAKEQLLKCNRLGNYSRGSAYECWCCSGF